MTVRPILLVAALTVLQPPALVAFGRYEDCQLFGAEGAALPSGLGIEFYDVPNYTFLDQPGAYELKASKVHWVSGPLQGEDPGDYDAAAGTIRFRPVLPGGGLPSGARVVCRNEAAQPR
jgi:hypothetical protein